MNAMTAAKPVPSPYKAIVKRAQAVYRAKLAGSERAKTGK